MGRRPKDKKIKIRKGQKFGLWTVINKDIGNYKALCRCVCGKEVPVFIFNLASNKSTCCGCVRHMTGEDNPGYKHGKSGTGTYQVWSRLLRSKKDEVCERWLDFVVFLKDMGEKPVGQKLVRINLTEKFGPKNCKWAKDGQRSSNRWITVGDKTLSLSGWSRELGISKQALRRRLLAGWDVERAFSNKYPLRKKYLKIIAAEQEAK